MLGKGKRSLSNNTGKEDSSLVADLEYLRIQTPSEVVHIEKVSQKGFPGGSVGKSLPVDARESELGRVQALAPREHLSSVKRTFPYLGIKVIIRYSNIAHHSTFQTLSSEDPISKGFLFLSWIYHFHFLMITTSQFDCSFFLGPPIYAGQDYYINFS